MWAILTALFSLVHPVFAADAPDDSAIQSAVVCEISLNLNLKGPIDKLSQTFKGKLGLELYSDSSGKLVGMGLTELEKLKMRGAEGNFVVSIDLDLSIENLLKKPVDYSSFLVHIIQFDARKIDAEKGGDVQISFLSSLTPLNRMNTHTVTIKKNQKGRWIAVPVLLSDDGKKELDHIAADSNLVPLIQINMSKKDAVIPAPTIQVVKEASPDLVQWGELASSDLIRKKMEHDAVFFLEDELDKLSDEPEAD